MKIGNPPGTQVTIFGLLEQHGQVRRTDPATSRQAAFAVKPNTAQHKLLVAHRDRPVGLTDEEAAELAGLDPRSEYATRCSELMRKGYIVDTELTRAGASGQARMVRRITQDGLTALALVELDW